MIYIYIYIYLLENFLHHIIYKIYINKIKKKKKSSKNKKKIKKLYYKKKKKKKKKINIINNLYINKLINTTLLNFNKITFFISKT